MKKTIRIKDIAKMAEVSMGTVDRVIHNRGKVSATSMEKVLKVLEKIDYQPNLIAKTLSSAKTYKIAALLPDASIDPFWLLPKIGISQAEKEFNPFGIEIYAFPFNPYQSDSFLARAQEVIDFEPDGILLAPIWRQESLDFTAMCKRHQIPLVCFNTYIEALHPLSFIGQNLHQSGRLAAELMCMGRPAGTFLIIHIEEKTLNSVHLYEKEQGFREYMQQNGNKIEVITIELESPHHPSFEATLEDSFRQYPQISGIFVTNSKAYDVAQYLEKTRRMQLRLIGYDLVQENLPFLQRHTIDILIHQNAEQQSFLGISYLTDHLVFKRDIPAIKHLSLGIVTSENLTSYI